MIIQCIQYIEFEQKGENQLTGLEKMGKLTFLTFFELKILAPLIFLELFIFFRKIEFLKSIEVLYLSELVAFYVTFE